MTLKLKPCPLCNQKPSIYESYTDGTYDIECDTFKCHSVAYATAGSEKDAIIRWNCRVLLDQYPALMSSVQIFDAWKKLHMDRARYEVDLVWNSTIDNKPDQMRLTYYKEIENTALEKWKNYLTALSEEERAILETPDMKELFV